jgi:hypothetical protein
MTMSKRSSHTLLGAMDPNLWVLVPFTRPHLAGQLLSYFLAQRLEGKRLLVVADRDGHPEADHVIRVESMRQGDARNVGLQWLREQRVERVSFWDDDDHYGPGYLEEQAGALRPGRLVGKVFGFVEFDDGVVYFPARRGIATTSLLIGGTMAGYVRELPDWTSQRIGEDGAFAMACRARRMETWTLSAQHWVYSRTGPVNSHAFRASDKGIWSVAGGRGIPCPLSVEECLSGEATIPEGNGLRWKEAHAIL